MNRILSFSLVASVLIFAGCDIVEDPIIVVGSQYQSWEYGDAPEFDPASNSMIFQRVFIEDFTGHDCGNCPGAAALTAQLKANNPDEIIVVGVHAGALAQPILPEFPSDFTTEAGEAWFSELEFPYNPVGRINRSPGLATSLFEAEWADIVDEEMNLEPDAVVQIEVEFIPEASHLNVHVFSEILNDIEGQVKMVLIVTEDGLEGPQLDYDQVDDPDTPENEQILEEYEFEHVLRGTINGSYGVIIGTDMVANETSLKSYTYEWPENWSADNSNVIAVVFEATNGRVLNSMEVHIDA
jgi:thiol-disulfide isomerase/thioredoxin